MCPFQILGKKVEKLLSFYKLCNMSNYEVLFSPVTIFMDLFLYAGYFFNAYD